MFRTHLTLAALALTLAACAPDEEPPPASESPEPLSSALTFVYDGEARDRLLVLSSPLEKTIPLVVEKIGDEPLTLDVPDPDQGDVQRLDDAPPVGAYTATLVRDLDGDGNLDDGEPIVGMGEFFLMWVGGPIEDEAVSIDAGWIAGGHNGEVDLDVLTLSDNLVPRPLTLSGAIGADVDADTLSIASEETLAGGATLGDTELFGDTFTLTLSEPPSAEHHWQGPSLGTELPGVTLAAPLTYTDLGEVGPHDDYREDPESFFMMCSQGRPVLITHVPPPRTDMDAANMLLDQVTVGWSATTVGAGEVTALAEDALSAAETSDLVIGGPDCQVD